MSRPKGGGGRNVALDQGALTWSVRTAGGRPRNTSRGVRRARDTGLVFCREDGTPIRPRSFSRAFDRHIADADLPRIRLHDLRHTWATLALGGGVHPKVVSERLGHAAIAITLDVYSHVSVGMQQDAADASRGALLELERRTHDEQPVDHRIVIVIQLVGRCAKANWDLARARGPGG